MIHRYAQFRHRAALRQARWWDEYPYHMTALAVVALGLRVYNAYNKAQQSRQRQRLTEAYPHRMERK